MQEKITQILLEIPNIPHISVPVGQSDKDNTIIKESGEIPTLENDAKPHWELVKDYKLIDFELGNIITGSGFPVYTNKGAKFGSGKSGITWDPVIDNDTTPEEIIIE